MNNAIKDTIKKLASNNGQTVINIRRYLHAHPELSFQELNTAKFVAKTLRSFNIDVQEGIAETGLTALIKGKNPEKKVVALRADMDALPIQETKETPYKSKIAGVMHACGHDAHTASLIGTAKILHALKDQFEGTIKLIFQPGEEKSPGGASLMIQEGVLENPKPISILGQHVTSFLPTGKVTFVKGRCLASSDEIYVTVKGKGGHAASPHLTIDPIVIASHIIVALQQITSRNRSPIIPSVLSFGKIISQGASNIIPDEVKIVGTFRTMDEPWRKEAQQKMKHMAQGIAKAMGGDCTFIVNKGYPHLENHLALTQRAKQAAIAFLGKENVVELPISMGTEDFAYYAQKIEACFYRLGTRNEAKGITSYAHTSTFDIDEDALVLGSSLMAWLALNELVTPS